MRADPKLVADWLARTPGATVRGCGPLPAGTSAAGAEAVVSVPVPPSVNNLFATAGKRRVKSRAYRAWLAVAVPGLARLRPPPSLPTAVRVRVVGPINRRRDLDNLLKPLGDALQAAGLIPGDSAAVVNGWRVWWEPAAAAEPAAWVSFDTGAK